jgi:hypothetical protein
MQTKSTTYALDHSQRMVPSLTAKLAPAQLLGAKKVP